MNLPCTIALPAAALSLVLFAPLAHGQGRGMRGSAGGFRAGSSHRASHGGEFNRQGGRRFENDFGFPFVPFLYPDYYPDGDLDYSAPAKEPPPMQARMARPYQPPTPPPTPGDTLVLENRNGQWVRIP